MYCSCVRRLQRSPDAAAASHVQGGAFPGAFQGVPHFAADAGAQGAPDAAVAMEAAVVGPIVVAAGLGHLGQQVVTSCFPRMFLVKLPRLRRAYMRSSG